MAAPIGCQGLDDVRNCNYYGLPNCDDGVCRVCQRHGGLPHATPVSPDYPGPVAIARHGLRDGIRLAAAALGGSRIRVDETAYAVRMAVCRACPSFDRSRERCRACGCCMNRDWFDKARYAATPCDLHRWPDDAWTPPKNGLSLGITIPVRNEGLESLRTVRNMRTRSQGIERLRFAIIDDASTDGGCNVFAHARDIQLVVNPGSKGEAWARNTGAAMLDEDGVDVLAWLDAHMRLHRPDGLARMAEIAMRTGGLVCGVTRMMGKPADEDSIRVGAKFAWNVAGGNASPGLRLNWLYRARHEEPRITLCDAVLGANYFCSAETWRRLGPWLDKWGLYGFGEQALCIKAWFLDVPRLCVGDVQFDHLFRVKRPYAMSGRFYWYSLAGATRGLFAEDLWRRHFLPVAARYLPAHDPQLAAIAADTSIDAWRETFAARKLHTDEEALAWLGII